jgi:molybdenum cofactor biosynthesis protein B
MSDSGHQPPGRQGSVSSEGAVRGPGGHQARCATRSQAPHHAQDLAAARCAILTISDTRTVGDDASGALLRALLEAAGHVAADYRIVRDEPDLVRRAVEEMAASGTIDVALLSGGTGIAPRDQTFEAVSALLPRRIDGFGELFRALSFEEIGAAAMLSRAVGGLVGDMVVFSMPGSTAACRLAMERLVLPQLGHVVALARPAVKAKGA